MKEATYKYKVYIRELNTSEEGINRKERAMRVTQAFASEMESVLKEYPEQWFNYYEFWDGAGE
jgi:predicted LPLAT superfamily acyltransferase